MISAAVASSLLTFIALAATGWLSAPTVPVRPLEIVVILSVVFIWGPAFALIPAAILGFLIERPLARRLIARRDGGFVVHLLIVTALALALWLMLRVAVVLSGPQTRIVDPLTLMIFAAIGVCSALSWWFLVVVPGRRA